VGFVKIYALGNKYIKTIFDDEVEITEKVDGSQFSFGLISDDLECHTKRTKMKLDHPEDQFIPAVRYVMEIADKLHPNWVYFGETLKRPKHNVIKYDRVPENHIAIFGILDLTSHNYLSWEIMKLEADVLKVDVVPCLFRGRTDFENAKKLISQVSFLGGANIEGFVVKNYDRPTDVGGVVFPIMCGKLVHESFKEKHADLASRGASKRDSWEAFCEGYCNTNRWRKAVRHLADDGTLIGDPRDIGLLVREIHNDIIEEEKDEILEFLWKHHSPHLLKRTIQGFPDWYKDQLANGEIDKFLGKDEDDEK